jgi:hypothetical protein
MPVPPVVARVMVCIARRGPQRRVAFGEVCYD